MRARASRWLRAARAPASALPITVWALLGGGAAVGGCGDGCPGGAPPEPTESQQVLLDPGSGAFDEPAPDTFDVRFETTAGEFVVRVVRDWAPAGAQRFYNLVRNRYYDGNAFYRVIPGYIAQFGAHPTPTVQAVWNEAYIPDDPVRVPNDRGTLVFAKAGENTRSTQLFVNTRSNQGLDALGFAPFGRIVSGIGVLDRLFGEYGETAPQGAGPEWRCIVERGSAYLASRFPRLDRIITAELVTAAPSPSS